MHVVSDRAQWRLQASDGSVVAANIDVAESMWSRFIGLMGRRELRDGHGLCIRPCSSIHMFFMRFPVDAVFVDGDGRIVRMYEPIRPWRVSRIVRRAKAVLELPAGTARAHGLGIGDVITLV
jgi:uncharacterized membrane protein (UPF0127 family)